MKRIMAVAAILLVASACSTEPSERFLAVMSGLSEVPPLPGTPAGGTATFTVNGDGLDFDVTVQSIVSVTSIYVHAGGAGEIGPAVATLYNGPTTGIIGNPTVLASGTLHPNNLTALSMDSLKTLMRHGKAYVNVATQAIATGEIRGQIAQN